MASILQKIAGRIFGGQHRYFPPVGTQGLFVVENEDEGTLEAWLGHPSGTQEALRDAIGNPSFYALQRSQGIHWVTDPSYDTLAETVAAGAGAKVMLIGDLTASAAIAVASGTTIEAVGPVTIEVPAGSSFRVFDLDAVSNVTIKGDIRFTKASGANLSGSAHAVSIRGGCADIVVEGATATGFVCGFNVAGHEGTVEATARRITFRDCTANDSPTNFGFNFEDCDTITLDNCYGRGNWLDGAKLQRSTKNVTVLGGAFTGNGIGYLTNSSLYAGDGLDAYAGGDTFVIEGTIFDGNYGNGVTIKTGGLNETDAADYGYVRNVQLFGLRCRGNLVGQGAYLALNDPGTMTQPVLAHVTIHGGQFDGNSSDGLYIGGRNVMVFGAMCKSNDRNGITVAARAFDVELHGCVSLANVTDNLSINGEKVRVFGGTYLGVESDTVTQESDLAGLTEVSRNNIRVEATADDVLIDNARCDYATTAPDPYVVSGAGTVVIHHRRTSGPPAVSSHGGVGSTYTRTDGSGGATHYTKTSGTADASTGWTRTMLTALPGRAVSAVQASFAHGLGYTPSVVVITPQSDVRAWESAAADDTNIYVTASGAGTVDLHYQ